MCGQPDLIEDLGTISPRSYVDQVLRLGPEAPLHANPIDDA